MYPGTSKTPKIHVNPVFKNGLLQKFRNNCEEPPHQAAAHINPKFISTQNTKTQTIYMNPNFLNGTLKQQKQDECKEAATELVRQEEQQLPKVTELNKIISKSRTRLIREHAARQQEKGLQLPTTSKMTSPILLLTKRKLIREAATTRASSSNSTKESTKRPLRYKLVNKSYIIKRMFGCAKKRRVNSFIARYALRRGVEDGDGNNKFPPTKINATATTPLIKTSTNKQLRLININGILYRSSQNKLQRRDENRAQLATVLNDKTKNLKSGKNELEKQQQPKGRTVYVRGTKFILDPQGFKLTRINTTNTNSTILPQAALSKCPFKKSTRVFDDNFNPRRIDIGGRTYMASSSNVFVRTSTHLVLAHLNQAKQRSVSVLSRSLRKVNRPCVIFQRIGKCAAFERNRCSKTHDKQQVIVCPKFLHDKCSNTNCLLSHNKSYQKMPVCKFFLQGCCVREDCLYLHKKLSKDSAICEDFRRGFCVLGEKCNKHHTFPEAKSVKAMKRTEPPYAPKCQKLLLDCRTENAGSPVEENAMTSRYFSVETFDPNASVSNDGDEAASMRCTEEQTNKCESTDNAHNEIQTNLTKRKPLGSLPAFIPLT